MTGPSHIVGAALVGLAAAVLSGVEPAGGVALVVGSLAAARLPDVDAKLIPGPAHRSLPHSLFIAGGMALVTLLLAVAVFAPALGGVESLFASV